MVKEDGGGSPTFNSRYLVKGWMHRNTASIVELSALTSVVSVVVSSVL